MRRGKPRAVLDPRQARAIFASPHRNNNSAYAVARLFGVSEKAIRDIWSGRTWRHATMAPPFRDPFAPDFRAYRALVRALIRQNRIHLAQ